MATSTARAALAALALIAAACAPLPKPPGSSDRTARFDWLVYSGSDPVDARARAGPGTYRNPVLQGFYSDPSITRVGDDYYLVTSTFGYFPGIPVFHSRDLVGWTQIGNAIDRPDQLDFKRLGLSRGVFAPTIEHKDGVFYILNTCVNCGGNFVITAKNPAGPWSDPMWLAGMDGIDPSLFFDDDGRAWIVNQSSPAGKPRYRGHRGIRIQEFDRANLRVTGPRILLVDGGVDPSTNPIWIEGPHLVKKDGWYYLTCAEGGTREGHAQVVFRSRSVTGPYVPGPGNPYLTQRGLPQDRADPITSAGHADMVQTAGGEWWATFLAVRPYGDDLYNTGRETFLMPVRWEGGWPRITDPGQAIPYVHARPALPRSPRPAMPSSGPFTVRYDFNEARLGPEWMMLRNPTGAWHRLASGALTLTPRPVGLGDRGNPSYLGRRQQHRNATVTTVLRFKPEREGEMAGLAALQSDEAWYVLALGLHDGRRQVFVRRRGSATEPAGGSLVASVPVALDDGVPVRLRASVNDGAISFYYALGRGAWRPLLDGADATILSTKEAGGFVGTTFGPFAMAAR